MATSTSPASADRKLKRTMDSGWRRRSDSALMNAARPNAIFLHCLPAHRGQEVTADVIANRLPTEQALVLALVEAGDR